MTRSRKTKIALITMAAAALVALTACGSQPAVCQKEDNLSNSISKLGSAITSVNLSEIPSAGQAVQSDANALVDSAKNTYPGQTAEVQQSVETLSGDIKNFSNSSDKTSAAIGLASSLTQVKNAFEGLKQKYQGSCG